MIISDSFYILLFVMEYSLASNGVNNAYFDRIIQNQVENDLH